MNHPLEGVRVVLETHHEYFQLSLLDVATDSGYSAGSDVLRKLGNLTPSSRNWITEYENH